MSVETRVVFRGGNLEAQSFGAGLKREREKKKITLDDVTAATKISARFLNAIEGGHFDQLPGGIFNKGFVRSYARHLGLNEDQTVADYLDAAGLNQPPEAEVPQSPTAQLTEARLASLNDPQKDLPWGKIVGILVVLAVVFAIWGHFSRKHEQKAAAAATQPTASATEKETLAAAATMPPPTAAPSATAPATTPAATPAPGPIDLRIDAKQDSWLLITVDGHAPAEEMLFAGSSRSVQAQSEIIVKAGNSGGLVFVLNGKKLPAQGDVEEVKTLQFDAGGVHVISVKVAQPKPATP